MYLDNNSMSENTGPWHHQPQLKNPLALVPIKKRNKVQKGKSKTNVKQRPNLSNQESLAAPYPLEPLPGQLNTIR